MSEADGSRGRHEQGDDGERVLLSVAVPAADREYLDRRAAADCGGDPAAALSRVITEARTFRHDLRGKLGALDLIELCLASDAMTRDEAARLIAELRREIREMIESVGGDV